MEMLFTLIYYIITLNMYRQYYTKIRLLLWYFIIPLYKKEKIIKIINNESIEHNGVC
jgi:hypothetical protein